MYNAHRQTSAYIRPVCTVQYRVWHIMHHQMFGYCSDTAQTMCNVRCHHMFGSISAVCWSGYVLPGEPSLCLPVHRMLRQEEPTPSICSCPLQGKTKHHIFTKSSSELCIRPQEKNILIKRPDSVRFSHPPLG